ncbi:MAG TPA: sensor histidine kinase [Thermoleophilaceae bacterium]|jgi:signal transduction histidine kinase
MARAGERGAFPRLHELAQLIAVQGRALVGARTLVLFLARDGETCLTAVAGVGAPEGWPRGDEQWVQPGAAFHLHSPSTELDGWVRCLGVPANDLLVVPVVVGDGRAGVMAACDKVVPQDRLTSGGAGRLVLEDEWRLQAFRPVAERALASSASDERAVDVTLRSTVEAREDERARWARELHDETLQNLAVVQAMLASALRQEGRPALEAGVELAWSQVRAEVASLRHLITELRPAALDRLGLVHAIASLTEQSSLDGLEVRVHTSGRCLGGGARLLPALELTAYRIVQEALRNVVRHARADVVDLSIEEVDGLLVIRLRDDGEGFLVGPRSLGSGLLGMEDRASIVGGSCSVSSDRLGTEIRATLPIDYVDLA